MHVDWQRLLDYVYVNRLPLFSAATLLGTAAVRTMPPEIPRTAQDFWTWGSDFAHQFFNIRNDRQGQAPGK